MQKNRVRYPLFFIYLHQIIVVGRKKDEKTMKVGHQIWAFCRKWGFLLLFPVLFLWLFPRFSGMRPVVTSSPSKELIAGVWVLLFLYSHYFFFIPHYLATKRYAHYIVLSIVTLLLCGAGEMLFLYNDLRLGVYQHFSLPDQRYFLMQDFVFVTMRDAGLLALFVMMKEIEIVNEQYAELQKDNIEQLRVIKVRDKEKRSVLLNINEILYCEQKRNYTHFYTETAEYTALCSLKSLGDQLGGEGVRISRNMLVMRHAIAQRKDSYVVLNKNSYPNGINRLIVNDKFRENE